MLLAENTLEVSSPDHIQEPQAGGQEPKAGGQEPKATVRKTRRSPLKCRVKDLEARLPKKTPRERDLLIYRWVIFQKQSQVSIAEIMGISQARVSQIVQEVRAWKATQPYEIPGMTEEQQINLATHETREWLDIIRDEAMQRHREADSSNENRHQIGNQDQKKCSEVILRTKPSGSGFLNIVLRATIKWGELGGAGQQWKRQVREEFARYKESRREGEPPAEPPAETDEMTIDQAPRTNREANGRLYSHQSCLSEANGAKHCSNGTCSHGDSAQVPRRRRRRKGEIPYNPFQPEIAEAAAQAEAEAREAQVRDAAWSQGDPCPEQVPLVTRPEVDRAVELCRGQGAVIVDLSRFWNGGRLQRFGCSTQEGPKILEEMAFVPRDASQPPKFREPLRDVGTSLTSEQRWDILDELGDVGVAVLDLDGNWHRAQSLAECNLSRDGTVIFREIARRPLYISGLGDSRRRSQQQDELQRLINPAGDETHARNREIDVWRGGVLSW